MKSAWTNDVTEDLPSLTLSMLGNRRLNGSHPSILCEGLGLHPISESGKDGAGSDFWAVSPATRQRCHGECLGGACL